MHWDEHKILSNTKLKSADLWKSFHLNDAYIMPFLILADHFVETCFVKIHSDKSSLIKVFAV